MLRTKKSSLAKRFVGGLMTVCFFVYMGALLYFLFFSDKYGRTTPYSEYRYNLELFREIRRFIWMGGTDFIINIIGNIAAFLPFGFLVPVMYREQRSEKVIIGHYIRSFFFVSFLGVLFSLFVEIVQLITKVGSFDVDDLFLNTVGVMLGYIGYVIAKEIIGVMGKQRRIK